MGRVILQIKLTNYDDIAAARRGNADPLRTVEVEALVDTGATLLCLKRSVIDQLGLALLGSTTVQTANGPRTVGKFGPVWLELIGRASSFNVLELDEATPNLLGQIPLEELDFVVDAKNQRLIPNPAHHGVQTNEIY